MCVIRFNSIFFFVIPFVCRLAYRFWDQEHFSSSSNFAFLRPPKWNLNEIYEINNVRSLIYFLAIGCSLSVEFFVAIFLLWKFVGSTVSQVGRCTWFDWKNWQPPKTLAIEFIDITSRTDFNQKEVNAINTFIGIVFDKFRMVLKCVQSFICSNYAIATHLHHLRSLSDEYFYKTKYTANR